MRARGARAGTGGAASAGAVRGLICRRRCRCRRPRCTTGPRQTGPEELETEEEAEAAAEAGRLPGDWERRRLAAAATPPLCLVCSEPLEVLPGGARGVSPPRCPPPP